jgi:hypothetical protein
MITHSTNIGGCQSAEERHFDFIMNEPQPPDTGTAPPVKLNEGIACDVCGRFGAVELGDRHLCVDCYEGCGSCCPEFGRDETP